MGPGRKPERWFSHDADQYIGIFWCDQSEMAQRQRVVKGYIFKAGWFSGHFFVCFFSLSFFYSDVAIVDLVHDVGAICSIC